LFITDISESRLEAAKKMGADFTLLVKTHDAQALAKKVEEMMEVMPDITIECSGAEASIQLAIYVSAIYSSISFSAFYHMALSYITAVGHQL
jgi:threonine dehydrogenase-like Zn-dependent dehydrogenase